MQKQILILLLSILSINCYAQISFEKGYFIDNTDKKFSCLIKNNDWKNTPSDFKYKLTQDSEIKIASIKTVKEFGIYNVSKHVRKTVEIDKSSNIISNLSYDRNPVFINKTLF